MTSRHGLELATSLEGNAAVVGELDAHPVVAGRHGLGKGGTATLFVDGNEVAEGRVEATVPMIFSGDETCDVGEDTASPVADNYPGDPAFTGRVRWVQLDIGDDDRDHVITPEQRLRVTWPASSCPPNQHRPSPPPPGAPTTARRG